jgi:TetR/AcrR family transcriptional regulator
VQQVCRALGTISTSKSQFRRPKVAIADTPTVNVPRDAGHRRRRQKRSLITRDKIIAAAIEEFSQCGLRGASVSSIAEKAGIDHGLITHHFGSKEALWQTVLTQSTTELELALRDSLANSESVGAVDTLKLVKLHECFIRFITDRPYFTAIMSHARTDPGVEIDSMMERQVTWTQDILIRLTRAAQAAGHYVEGDPAHLVLVFLGAAARVHMMPLEVKRLTGRGPFSRSFMRDHIRLCRRLFFRNLEDLSVKDED